MSFEEMKNALSALSIRMTELGNFEDPESYLPFASSQPTSENDLLEVMSIIKNFQRSILGLSQTLDETLRRYSTLVTPLVQRSVLVAKRTAPPLPNETILQMCECLVEEGSHHLKPLLLVNKRFHQLIMSTPSLWCNIHLKFDSKLEEVNELSVYYIERCIERGQMAPLNIDVDISDISGPQECASSIFRAAQRKMPEYSSLLDLIIDSDGIAGIDDDAAFYIGKLDAIEYLVLAAMGPGLDHIHRWRSLKFTSPTEVDLLAGEIVWHLFEYPMPNLETFTLFGSIASEYALFGNDIPDLTAVRHLTFHDVYHCGGPSAATLSWDRLVTLVISYYAYPNLLEILSDCRALQELAVADIYDAHFAARRDLNMPFLRKLTLKGDPGLLKDIVFHTPRLECLVLVCLKMESIPRLRARSVIWEPIGIPHDDMVKAVQQLLVGIQEMEELVIEHVGLEWLGTLGREVADLVRRCPEVSGTLKDIKISIDDNLVDAIRLKND
ncbi:hypothetical protein FRC17_001488 [Serendipita sp. 399]|nr:hypothetical protein FRC17_001488 [Serendipita sp. 399]